MYIVTVLVYCILCMFMIKLLVHITLPMPCLVSMNSSSDDLIDSLYYMLIHGQHISVLRIVSNFCINTQSNYICKLPCSQTKGHKPPPPPPPPNISNLPTGNTAFLIGQTHPERRDYSHTLKGSRTVPPTLLLNLLIAARVESLSRCGRARCAPTASLRFF